jgi:cytochrome c biogenesis protein ResB
LPKDSTIVGRVIFFILIYCFLLVSLFFIASTKYCKSKRAVKVSSVSYHSNFYGKTHQADAEFPVAKRDRSKYLTGPQMEYRNYAVNRDIGDVDNH